MQVISIKRHPIIHNQQKFMVISKQLLFLQGTTFCHLIFMQNVTEGLPPTERAQKAGRLQHAVDFATRISDTLLPTIEKYLQAVKSEYGHLKYNNCWLLPKAPSFLFVQNGASAI